jgi:hypothetical protein
MKHGHNIFWKVLQNVDGCYWEQFATFWPGDPGEFVYRWPQ